MSFEKKIVENPNEMPAKLDIGLLKYLWSASPVSMTSRSYHKFFSALPLFSSFSDNEIRLFTKYIHERKFQPQEIIFRQQDSGYGFYFIFSGKVEILNEHDLNKGIVAGNFEIVNTLKVGDYFGEMGLLEEFNRRDVTAITKTDSVLLGIFKPDLDDLFNHHPVIGAKFLREISQLMATKLGEIIKENHRLKKQINNER